jgi:hypothetical protein
MDLVRRAPRAACRRRGARDCRPAPILRYTVTDDTETLSGPFDEIIPVRAFVPDAWTPLHTQGDRGRGAMLTLIAIPITCWLCALVAIPRRPRLGNEGEELVYARMLGRQQRLMLLALVATLAAFVAIAVAMPRRVQPNPVVASSAQQVCTDEPMSPPTCYTPQPSGTWVKEELQTDGTWLRTGAQPYPPPAGALARGLRG